MRCEKGEERFRQKADANSGRSRQKHYASHFTTYATGNII